jgi:uncharacterized membrane protein
MLVAHAGLRGDSGQRKWLARGFAAGAAAALALSLLKSTTVLINREYWNMGILSVAVLAGALFCLLSCGLLGKSAPALRGGAWRAAYAVLAAALPMYALPDLLLYPAEFAARGESLLGTDVLLNLAGYLAGLLIVGLSSLALRRAASGLSPAWTGSLFSVALAVNMANQIATIVQFLIARRIIPMPRWLFAIIRTVINYNAYFLYAIMAASILLPIAMWAKTMLPVGSLSGGGRAAGGGGSVHGAAQGLPQGAGLNPAQIRKLRARARRQRRWCAAVAAGYAIAVLSQTALRAYNERELVLSPAEPMDIVGAEIAIPLEIVSDGHLHRFAYAASNGTEVRFIVVRKNMSSNAFGVGLDACDICGDTGYYERENDVICKLCDVVMNKSTIGFKGGCNPVPLAYALETGRLLIQTQSLEDERSRFE